MSIEDWVSDYTLDSIELDLEEAARELAEIDGCPKQLSEDGWVFSTDSDKFIINGTSTVTSSDTLIIGGGGGGGYSIGGGGGAVITSTFSPYTVSTTTNSPTTWDRHA